MICGNRFDCRILLETTYRVMMCLSVLLGGHKTTCRINFAVYACDSTGQNESSISGLFSRSEMVIKNGGGERILL